DSDQDGGQCGEAVDVQGEFDRYRAGRGEFGGGVDGPFAALPRGDQGGQHEGGEWRQDGERADEAGGGTAQRQPGDRAEERKEGDEDGEGGRGHAVASAFSAAARGAEASLSDSSLPGPSGPSPSGSWP